ncbi:VWA domain-containing protein [Cellulomonas sp. PhB143]|uniref:DUF7927 domain-containing protein n=1 Tax=Cellulomonas sp. PhB143 TaxID=2485186 RepID=UPI000F473A62|nr:VWA domain-containing protein [Cellulomonas sp. PhB143]ROS78756.1 von Willebrand factor type A domain-containing protein [Cellulomonas sp. PhB143]
MVLSASMAMLLAASLSMVPVAVAVPVPASGASAAVAPLAVPPATGNDAVITVKVGGDRTSAAAVGNLAGVTLGLFTSAAATTPVAGFGTCVSDADGDCSFTVPSTQQGGGNRDRQLYVRQIGTAPGFYANPSLGTGSPVTARGYAIQTSAQLRAGTTYRSTADFMVGTGGTNDAASGGIWQSSRDNPVLPAQCGLTVGLVLDLSNSVTDAQLVDLKAAANGFVDALTGTPSQIGTFTFATSAPATAGDTLAPTSVSTAGGAARVRAAITGYAKPGGNAGGTNWDRGIGQVALSTSPFDVAVVITDGNPTFYGNGEGPGNRTRFRETENGIFSSNALKAQGTRVVAFGVGDGASNAASGLNLRSLSGPTLGSDYYQSSDYAEAGEQLRELALGSCAGSITVVKQVVPSRAPVGSTVGAVPQGGWTFAGAGSADVAVDAPASRVTADGTGAANFPLTFSGGTTAGPVTLTETQQDGYTLQQVNGGNAVCSRVDTGASVPVTNEGTTGFTVPASSTYPVSCVVYNRAPTPLASVVLHKEWVINGTTYADGEQPPILVASGTVDGVLAPWEQRQTGFLEGDTVEIDETTDLSGLPLCTQDSARLTEANGSAADEALPDQQTLAAGVNSFTLTNTLTCETRLALTKTVQGGDADPDDWTLTAAAPAGADAGPSGTSGVSAPVTPAVAYVLSEDQPHPEYLQFTDPNATLVPGSSGSWNCQEVEADGTTVIPGFQDGLNGGVTVPFGTNVRCDALNRTATLVLAKSVENTHGGTAVPGDWSLTATPTGDVPPGLTAQTVPGSTDGASFTVRPGVTYTLTESGGPPGYALDSIRCAVVPGGTGTATITLDALDTGTCAYTNVDTPAELTLVKTVTNDEGGTAEPTDWTLSAAGPTPVSGATGDDAVTGAEVNAGTYTLAESGGPAGYTAGAWSCTGDGALTGSSLDLGVGQAATCTIDNDDQPATLTLVKVVDTGETGSDATPSDWTLTASPSGISGQEPVSGTGDPTAPGGVDGVSVFAGSYALSEDGPAGFDASDWVCQGGVLDGDGSTVTVPSGGNVVCTITNEAVSPTLTLVKEVAGDDAAAPTAWTLAADGPTPLSGASGSAAVTAVDVAVGSYDLSESSGPAGYEAGAWRCDGGPIEGSTVTVALGADVTCTITNTLPGTFDVAKTSDPPSGSTVAPGDTITYTVTARKLAGVDPQDVVVDDDLSGVLTHAALVPGSISASVGAAELDGTTLRWTIPGLQGTQTLTYQAVVASDADDVTLTNVITSPGSETCAPPASDLAAAALAAPVVLAAPAAVADDVCSTTHVTPGPGPSPAPSPTSSPAPSPASPTSSPSGAPPAPPATPGGLATTGGPGAAPAVLALALLSLGAALVLAARRRGGAA